MQIRSLCVIRFATVGSMLGILIAVYSATVGAAQAQNTATAPSRTSQSGIQSAITHIRDSLQRHTRTNLQRSRHQQPEAPKPDSRGSDR